MSVKEYLLLYFRQKHFDAMPDAERAQFDVYAKNDDFRGDMKSWKRDLMEENGQNKPLPDAASELDKSGWESLFKSLQNALVSMSANKGSFKKNDEATRFLDTYFGDPNTQIFSLTPIDPTIDSSIKSFINTIVKDPNSFAMFGDMFNDDYDEYKNFVKSLDRGKYEEDPTVRKKLVHIVSVLARRLEYGDIYNEALRSKLEALDLNSIINGLNQDTMVDPKKLKRFKSEYQNILNTLYDQPKIYDVFKQYDNGKISKQLDEAIAKTDYTGKITEKDYIPPKRRDEKTVWQNINDGIKDTYDSVLKKYVTAHRDRVFIKPTAKAIFSALDGAGIKPTDGIATILKNDKIAGKLKYKSPMASEHFEWFVKIMTDFQQTMPKAFEGALRNGHQMKRIIEEMVLVAVEESQKDPEAINKAKTAMEVLSVMQYGLFTSRTMDAINKIDMTIFSDKNLSWNKNEGIQFVTKALDKTIKFGIQAAGYAATVATNKIRHMGRTFDHSGTLQKKSEQWEADNLNDKNYAEKAKRKQNALDNKEIKRLRIHKRSLGITNVRQAEKALRTGRQLEDLQNNDHENAKAVFAPYEETEKDFETVREKEKTVYDCQNAISALETELNAIPYPVTDQLQKAEAEQKRNDLAKLKNDLQQYNQELTDIQTAINAKYAAKGTTLNDEHNRIHLPIAGGLSLYDTAKQDLDRTKATYEATKTDNDDLEHRISEYRSDKESIEAHRENIKRRNEEFAKWDNAHKNQYLELMAYWDFLQTGKTKNLFHFSTKKLQAKMDKKQISGKTKMEEAMLLWQQQHGYAA